jgi:RNA recognition motif-containing protein
MKSFVGNVPFSITEHELRELFVRYGVVERVNVVTDRETGRARGVGFVEMADDSAARAAIAGLQGHALAGRAITVNEARPREDRQGPRGPRGAGRRDGRGPRW